MTLLAMLRHAPTDWNKAKRLQGRADIALSAQSRQELGARRLPDEVADFKALCSPLRRCVETASLLGLSPTEEARLIEMHWGDYEGHSLPDLRRTYGEALAAQEKLGLDFRPPRGESPRDVQTRMAPLLKEIAADSHPVIAVTHRGVIRSVYALATGWDMRDDAPDELDLYALHLFRLRADGTPDVAQLNIPLALR
jgi:broad specificity phosphatase PhoE